jgi:hypothetical protein
MAQGHHVVFSVIEFHRLWLRRISIFKAEVASPLELKKRYLASGDSICSLAFTYRLGFETVSQCIMETCEAIERKMLAIHLPRPTEEAWR